MAESPATQEAGSRQTVRELLGDRAKDRRVIGARIDGAVFDMHTEVRAMSADDLDLVRVDDADGIAMIRHSSAHIMADAVQQLFPGTKVTIGPSTAHGFYYDFDKRDGAFTDADLETIEKRMKDIIAGKHSFRRDIVTREEALALFDTMGENYKREIIAGIPEGEALSLYRHGAPDSEWVDLCAGPHVPNTQYLRAFKLVSVAGAYWRGDETNPMLQRIYGTAFGSPGELREHLRLIDEAKKRDHRKLGKELELFMFHDYAPAMPFFLPRGAFVYTGLVNYMRSLYQRHGYDEVITPQIFDKKLFETSGHLPNYRKNMYLPVTADLLDEQQAKQQAKQQARQQANNPSEDAELDDHAGCAHHTHEGGLDLERLAAKPMNCPSHCLIFKHRRRSYRELPWRIADFCRLHRYERGGVVHGLARVRSFAQDDAHIFCTPDQMQEEISRFITLLYEVYHAFAFAKIDVKLATRPQKRIGTDAQWDSAEQALEQALKQAELPYEILPEEGAFYGPKLEFHIEDALKRSWQLGTIQVDYALPDRFDLNYIGSDGAAHRPVMLHRAILGSLERFMSVLIEHTGGAFPAWLAPEQATVVTVSEKHADYAQSVVDELNSQGLRVNANLAADKLGAKIRIARLARVPYILVVGDKEVENGTLSPRSRDLNKNIEAMTVGAFADKLVAEAKPPRLENSREL